MGSIAGAALGAGASLLGGVMSGNAQKDAAERAAQAAQFNPFNVYGPGGSAVFAGDSVRTSLDPQQEALRNQFLGLAGGQMGALDPRALAGITGAGLGAQTAGAPLVGAETMGFLDQSRMGDAAYQGLFNQFAGQVNPLAAGAAGFLPLGQQAAMGAFGPGVADNIANFAAGRGAELLGQDFGGVRDAELARMRSAALPSQERAVDSTLTNLFTSGRLGSTGGANVMGRLAEAQNQQDLGFQMAATQTGQNLLNANRALGQNLLGLGQQGLLSGFAGNVSRAGTLGNLGLGGASTAGNLFGNVFGAGQGTISGLDSRALQRIAGAQNLFGFGQGITSGGFNQALQGLGAAQSQDEAARALAALGGNIGGQQAAAGANAGQFINQTGTSPFGAGMLGLGGGLFNQSVQSYFNPPQAPATPTPPGT